jgi:hypothetical protein
MIQMLLSQPLEQADLSELIAISSGAAPLAADVRREFEARVPSASIYEGYGCTEAATFISANPLDARRVGSVGLPVPGCEVSIQDDAGQLLPANQDGEICVRSPGVMTGYWHTQDSSATVLAGGWLHTGDIGHLDDDGYLYVVDRKKDLILRGGFNVYPRDIEDVLVAHPAVAQAGVVGRPDARLGEEIVAFVSLRPDAQATAAELTEYARQHLAANKYPRQITIVETVPLTSVGKLDRKTLRKWIADVPAQHHRGRSLPAQGESSPTLSILAAELLLPHEHRPGEGLSLLWTAAPRRRGAAVHDAADFGNGPRSEPAGQSAPSGPGVTHGVPLGRVADPAFRPAEYNTVCSYITTDSDKRFSLVPTGSDRTARSPGRPSERASPSLRRRKTGWRCERVSLSSPAWSLRNAWTSCLRGCLPRSAWLERFRCGWLADGERPGGPDRWCSSPPIRCGRDAGPPMSTMRWRAPASGCRPQCGR